MARISTYPIDDVVTGDDRWIGTDVSNKNATKNFTPNNVAAFLNSSNKIDTQSLRYKYQHWKSGHVREAGAISLEEQSPDTSVLFSSISSFKISEKEKGKSTSVSTFYTSPLVGSFVLITNAKNVSNWAIYRWDSAVVDPGDSSFWNIGLILVSSAGGFEEDLEYLISLLQLSSVTRIIAGEDILVDPESGTGDVTVTSTAINDKTYVHPQGSASNKWVVNHNLNKYPSITVMDSANSTVIGSVVYNSLDQVTLTFSSEFSGFAYFN
tara:strand:- start:1628 stop:2428 length:801 start_codon:yes stop_codon:yes gene_type:complete